MVNNPYHLSEGQTHMTMSADYSTTTFVRVVFRGVRSDNPHAPLVIIIIIIIKL